MAGILAGFALWAYTLFLPSFADAGWIDAQPHRPMARSASRFFRPRMLFNLAFDPLTHGVLWSLAGQFAAYVARLADRGQPLADRADAGRAFVSRDMPLGAAPGFRLWRTAVTVGAVARRRWRAISAPSAPAAPSPKLAAERSVAA